jgi:hypothetical protein
MSVLAREAAVLTLREDRLAQVAATYRPGETLADEYLWGKLRSAEAGLERDLRVFLEPVEILPEGTPQAEIDALAAAGTRYELEPAYDYDPEYFRGDGWAMIRTRQRPIVSVSSIVFAYPTPQTTVWTVPADWIRVDHKYGVIRLVPTGSTYVSAPLSTYVLGMIGGGRIVPQVIRVRYRAGLADVANRWPDLTSLIYRSAAIGVIEDALPPGSGSVSVDGLSQSVSTDTGRLREQLAERIEHLRQAIHGIRLGVL